MSQLEQYRVFEAVARSKSFSKACEELFITQPAVSQSIKQLETELGTRLFVRNSRGVTLTESGNILFSYVENALSILKGAEEHIAQLKALEVGTLNIGASDTLSCHYLLPYLQAFHKEYPKISLKVTNRTSKETVLLLKSGKVDIGFINMPTELDDDISSTQVLELNDCFVYNPEFFDIGEVNLKDLSQYPLLMLERESSSRLYLDSFFASQGIAVTPSVELGSHDLLISFAEIGLGIAAVVRQYAKSYINTGRLSLLNLKSEIPPRYVSLIYRKNIPLAYAAKEFVRRLYTV